MLLRILQGAIFNDNAIGSHAFQKENSSLMFTFKISGHWKLTAGFYNNHWKSTSFSEIIITLEAAKSYQNKYPSFLRQPSSHFSLPFLEFFFFFFWTFKFTQVLRTSICLFMKGKGEIENYMSNEIKFARVLRKRLFLLCVTNYSVRHSFFSMDFIG